MGAHAVSLQVFQMSDFWIKYTVQHIKNFTYYWVVCYSLHIVHLEP